MTISDFQSQFSMSKIIWIFFNFSEIEEYQFRGMFLVVDIFWKLGCWSNKNFSLWKSAIYHSIKLPFDAKVAEKSLKCYLLSNQLKVGKLLPKKQPIFFLNFHLLIILIKNSCRIHKKVWYIWQNLWIFLIIYLKFVLFFLYFPPI